MSWKGKECVNGAGGWKEGPFFTLDCVDVRGEVDPAGRIEETAEGLQAGLDLEKGPLVRLGLVCHR